MDFSTHTSTRSQHVYMYVLRYIYTYRYLYVYTLAGGGVLNYMDCMEMEAVLHARTTK